MVKTTVGHFMDMAEMISNAMKRPMSKKTLKTLNERSDNCGEIVESFVKDYDLEGKKLKALESSREKYKRIEVLLKNQKPSVSNKEELSKLLTEKKQEDEEATKVIMTAFREESIDLPSCEISYEEALPAAFNLLFIKSALFKVK